MSRQRTLGGYSPATDELRESIDGVLSSYLAGRRRAVPEAIELIDEIERVLGAGGKRLRPAFCYWGFRAAGGSHCDEIVRAAASLELLHTFAIVHDDIMDAADERRGVPTTHDLHGVSFGLLAGDLALVLADELFMFAGFPAAMVVAGFAPYSLMRQEVIAGQHLDLEAAHALSISEDQARRIAVLKSGRYSIEKPLMIGATLAGASADAVQGLSSFGDPLGEAFQLRDDLLGTFGERSSTGKPIDSDIREGKRNLLFALTVARLHGADAIRFASRWGAGDDLAEDEVVALRDLVESSGAREATERLLEERSMRAAGALARLILPADARIALSALARQATDRAF